MSVTEVNTYWQKGLKKEAARTSPQPKSKKGSWLVPTQFKTLLPQRIGGRKKR